jgi:hypothetical protein
MDLRLPGIILMVTGIVAVVVSLTRGPNLRISRRAGVLTGVVLLFLGAALLAYTATAAPAP